MTPSDYFPQEFFSEDFRTNRPFKLGLPMTDFITVQKHVQCLPPDLVKNKHILDIGSFIGQTGHWCLKHGAASYTGVEINSDFADKSRELLNKHNSGQDWTIITSSLEDYYASNDKKFDLVYSWNVLFYHYDHTWFLKQMAQRADHVIVSGRHPKILWRALGTDFTDRQWNDLEYNIPYTEWQDRIMTGVAGHNASLGNFSANSSIAAVKEIMRAEGFKADLTAYEKLKQEIPDHFGMFRDHKHLGFYVIDFQKDISIDPACTMDNMYKNSDLWNKNYRPWNKI